MKSLAKLVLWLMWDRKKGAGLIKGGTNFMMITPAREGLRGKERVPLLNLKPIQSAPGRQAVLWERQFGDANRCFYCTANPCTRGQLEIIVADDAFF